MSKVSITCKLVTFFVLSCLFIPAFVLWILNFSKALSGLDRSRCQIHYSTQNIINGFNKDQADSAGEEIF